MIRRLWLLVLLLPIPAHAAGFRITSGDDDYVVRGTACPALSANAPCGSVAWPAAFGAINGGPGCNTNFTLSGVPSVLAQTTLGTGPTDTVDEILLKWDTSAIPAGATVTDATLTVKVSFINVISQTLNGDWFNWDGGCDVNDFTPTTASGAFTPFDPSGWTVGSLRTITLTNVNNIATGPGAVTFLRLTMSLAAAPTQTNNGVGIVDFAGDPANAALLDVNYAQFSPTPTGTVTHTPGPTSTPTSAQSPTRLPTNTPVPGGTPPNTPVPNCGERLPQ